VMCFKDRTFCRFTGCVVFNICPRSFTEELKEEALSWWGSEDYPVCFYSTKPECYEETETG